MPAKDNPPPVPPEPWRSFLRELYDLLKGRVELRCLGGFVITQQYGIGRETSDIDYLALADGESVGVISSRDGWDWDRSCIANIGYTHSTSQSRHLPRNTGED